MGRPWSEAALGAVRRHVRRTSSTIFSRQALIEAELDAIVAETGSGGATPEQTLSRELQQLRDAGVLEFVETGVYRYAADEPLQIQVSGATKGVFLYRPDSEYRDEPARFYRFPRMYHGRALSMVGQWVIYMEPSKAGERGYHAVARVEKVVPDPSQTDMFLALIEPGTYLEFDRDVPWRLGGELVERGLLNPDGRVNNGRAVWAVRPISNADFNRIIDLGLMRDLDELPRVGEALTQENLVSGGGQATFEVELIDRPKVLANRAFRDAKFRKVVLHAYEGRCALTGMRLVNGGGRLETEAAHIMSVAAGGPDAVSNGIALSGTVHWMFDRGLISVSDAGDILLSGKINDREGVEKMIYPDRRARLPLGAYRPHPRYLAWHRQQFGFQT